MTQTITRIQFSPNKVTIYDTDGVFAIWQGKPAAVLNAILTDAINGIVKKIEEEKASLKDENQTTTTEEKNNGN